MRLRSNTSAGPLPPPEHDLGMVWIESQCAAVPEDPDDELLINWKKVESPFLPLPPPEMELTGWRDPFVFTCNTLPTEDVGTPLSFRPENGPPGYRILMGSGIKGKGGTALVYRSSDLMKGWELEGTLCEGSSEDTGVVWECPVLVPLLPVPHTHRSKTKTCPPLWLHHATATAASKHPSTIPEEVELNGSVSVGTPRKYRSPSTSFPGAAGPPSPLSALNLQQSNESGVVSRPPARHSSLREPTTSSFGNFDAFPATEIPPRAPQESQIEFEFSSGGASPHAFARQGSVELWPSSAEATSPSEPIGLAAGSEEQDNVDYLSNGALIVSELAAKLERAATLEHWHQGDKNNSGDLEHSTSSGSSSRDRRSNAMSATIGSKLDSVNDARLSSLAEDQEAIIIDQNENENDDKEQEQPSANSGPQSPRRLPPKSPFSSSKDDLNEDKFALAFSRVPALHVKPVLKNEPSAGPTELLANMSIYSDVSITPAPTRQWHFFTVSPDAPTNPVLYWTGFMNEGNNGGNNNNGQIPQFDIETAKGPFRLDLGDILYAPNVCQDAAGRWLLWGWLQERRKMGTYSYAGCLSLPRVLHVTDDGRLVQAPAPEVTTLRQGNEFHAQHVTLYPEAVVPLERVSGDRLDIEVTIERGSALAAGVLFRSHEAEAEGSTAIVYDWDRNHLEAIFNVPPNWQPCSTAPAPLHRPQSDSEDIFDEHDIGVFDAAAYLCTPRYSMSRTPSLSAISPSTSSPMAHLDPGETPPMSPYPRGDLLGLSTAAGGAAASFPVQRQGSSLSQCLQRTSSHAALGTSFSAGPAGFGTSLSRGGSLLQRQTSFLSMSPRSMAVDAAEATEMDAELSNLLEELAAPMRGAAEEPHAPPQEPRRVGGPLLMRPSDRLHLRIFVDHSCIEVFTGTGEVLSTRVYRGRQPLVDGETDAGIEFVAFGGAAILEKVSAYEVESAWEEKPTPTAAAGTAVQSPAAAGVGSNGPGSSPSSAKIAGDVIKSPTIVGGVGSQSRSAAERADDLFDEIMMSITSTATVTAASGQ